MMGAPTADEEPTPTTKAFPTDVVATDEVAATADTESSTEVAVSPTATPTANTASEPESGASEEPAAQPDESSAEPTEPKVATPEEKVEATSVVDKPSEPESLPTETPSETPTEPNSEQTEPQSVAAASEKSLEPTPTTAVELPAEIWDRVFRIVGAESPGMLAILSRCSRLFYEVSRDPSFRAGLFLYRSGKHLAFLETYLDFPWALNFEVVDAMFQQGAVLPKLLVERLFRENQINPETLPEGTVQYVVAQGYKLYGDKLHLGEDEYFGSGGHGSMGMGERGSIVDSGYGDSKGESSRLSAATEIGFADMVNNEEPLLDDASEFEACLCTATPDIVRLRQVVEKHHYTPALCPPVSPTGWQDLWARLLRLARIDSKLALFLARHAGCEWDFANTGIMACALRDSKTDGQWLRSLLGLGFKLTRDVVCEVLTSTDYMITSSPEPTISLLKSSPLPPGDLEDHVECALQFLFQEATPSSLHLADFLITEFELDENAIGRAFFPDPYDLKCLKRSGYIPVMMTTFGKRWGGMRDRLWQFVMARQGVDHPYLHACLNDLVVGGLMPLPKEQVTLDTSVLSFVSGTSIGSFDRSPTSATGSSVGRMIMTGSEDENDAKARDSIEALMEAGVSIEPSMFGPIARTVFCTRGVYPRHLDFLTRIERALLGLDERRGSVGGSNGGSTSNLFASPPTPGGPGTPEPTRRWSKVRWVAAFRRYVLDDRDWRERLFGEKGYDDSGSASSTSVGAVSATSTLNLIGGSTGDWTSGFFQTLGLDDRSRRETAQIRRFHGCIAALVVLLTAPESPAAVKARQQLNAGTASSSASSELTVGPFGKWLGEVDAKIAKKNAAAEAAAAAATARMSVAAAAAGALPARRGSAPSTGIS
ncbi:hypothetical protein HK102_007213, partial [Quaeritorhiza haematococci]